MYNAFVKMRNYLYSHNMLKVYSSAYPVISIGNISSGGSGKTPCALMIAKICKDNSIQVSLLSSGYKRTSKGICTVSSSYTMHNDIMPEQCGDEVYMQALSGYYHSVIVSQPKYKALSHFTTPIIIDDGFQHRAIKRDCNIVLLHSSDIKRRVFPWGTLRESLDALLRADIIICTDTFHIEKIEPFIKHKPLICKSSIHIGSLYSLDDILVSHKSYITLQNSSIYALSGIAHPRRFHASIQEKGYSITKIKELKDHVKYTDKVISQIIKEMKQLNLSTIITTEKDAVKLYAYRSTFEQYSIQCFVLPITFEIIEGKQEFLLFLQKLLTSNSTISHTSL